MRKNKGYRNKRINCNEIGRRNKIKDFIQITHTTKQPLVKFEVSLDYQLDLPNLILVSSTQTQISFKNLGCRTVLTSYFNAAIKGSPRLQCS